MSLLDVGCGEGWITRDISAMNHRILTASLTRKGEEELHYADVQEGMALLLPMTRGVPTQPRQPQPGLRDRPTS